MKFYEVSVEAESQAGDWQGIGYWFVKPAREHFSMFLQSLRLAIDRGLQQNDLWHEKGLMVLINVIDVEIEVCHRYQRAAYLNDQADRPSSLQWVLTSPRFSLNGDGHGQK